MKTEFIEPLTGVSLKFKKDLLDMNEDTSYFKGK